MCELLVKAIDAVHADADKDRAGCYKKGDVVMVKPDGWTWGVKETLPIFVIVKVPGVTVAAAQAYMDEWQRLVAISVLSSDPSDGTYQAQVSCTNAGASGLANLDQQDVETYLNQWGATLDSADVNQITFTVALWQTLQSNGFWGADVALIGFALVSYDSGTGQAVVEINISGVLGQWTPQQIGQAVAARGGTVIGYTEPVGRFSIHRSTLLTAFSDDLKEKLQQVFSRRQYYFSDADVDLVTANGGEITLTAAQATGRINSKLDD